jgi:hypothetical protein
MSVHSILAKPTLLFVRLIDNLLFVVLLVFTVAGVTANLLVALHTTYVSAVTPGAAVTTGERLTVLSVAVFCGLLLGRLRYKWQKLYGIIELGVGIAAAWSLTGGARGVNPLNNFLALAAATYLIGRGF